MKPYGNDGYFTIVTTLALVIVMYMLYNYSVESGMFLFIRLFIYTTDKIEIKINILLAIYARGLLTYQSTKFDNYYCRWITALVLTKQRSV